MAKKETAPKAATYTIADLFAAIGGYSIEQVVEACKALDAGDEKPAGKGKGKKGKDADDDEPEDEGKKGKGKGKGKKADAPDAKTVKKLRKQIAELIEKIGDLDDEDAEEDVEDLLADFDVEEVKKLKDDQLTEFAAKLEEIFEEYDEE